MSSRFLWQIKYIDENIEEMDVRLFFIGNISAHRGTKFDKAAEMDINYDLKHKNRPPDRNGCQLKPLYPWKRIY